MGWPLLNGLDESEQRAVLASARRRRFSKGSTIFWEGDPGDGLHLVARGHVALQLTTRRGDVATVRVIGAGEHFGELALVSAGPRSATATALDAVETVVLHREDLDRLRRTDPSVSDVLIEALAGEVRRLAGALVDALYLDANDHLWRRLDDLAHVFATDGDGTTVVVPLTQAELAGLAGVTRQTAHAFLQKAAERDIVSLQKKGAIVVTNRDLLAKLAGR